MRIAVANLFQLTNSFNRRRTEWSQWSLTSHIASAPTTLSQPAIARFIQSMIQAAEQANGTIVPIVEGFAPAGGPLSADARAELLRVFKDRLAEEKTGVDALIVILSGCVLDEEGNSVDGALLREARNSMAASCPLVVLWSNLANLTEAMIEPADLNLSYDLRDPRAAETLGRKVVSLTHRLVRKELEIHHEFRKLPLLLPPSSVKADREPLLSASELAHEFEARSGVLSVSICTGFPYADCPGAGASLIVAVDAESNQVQGQGLASRLRTAIWTERDAFFPEPMNIEMAVHEAMQSAGRSVVIADAGDDPVLGAPSEGTGMLWGLVDLGAQDATLAAIVDPVAVERAVTAGAGSTLKMDLGGRTDHSAGYPIEVTARVRRITENPVLGHGRFLRLDVVGRHEGSVEVVVCEQPLEPTPELFAALGIDLPTKRIIALKSSWRVQEAFGYLTERLIEITTPGMTTPVLSFFDYERLPRPIYPLDAV